MMLKMAVLAPMPRARVDGRDSREGGILPEAADGQTKIECQTVHGFRWEQVKRQRQVSANRRMRPARVSVFATTRPIVGLYLCFAGLRSPGIPYRKFDMMGVPFPLLSIRNER